MRSKNINYLPELDAIRGVASLWIVFYHSAHMLRWELINNTSFRFDDWPVAGSFFSSLLWEGHTAVTLFMVLSGFVFVCGALDKKIEVGKFYFNRVLRTYPMFFVMVFLGVLFESRDVDYYGLCMTLLGFGSLPGAINLGPYSAMFWSLSLEWQFYFLFPFLIFVLRRFGPKYILVMLFVFVFFEYVAVYFGANARDVSYWSVLGRMPHFLIGMLVAWVWRRYKPVGRWLSLLLASGLVVAMLVVLNRLGGWPASGAWRPVWGGFEGVAWGLFLLAVMGFSGQIRGGAIDLLIWFGERSYSIYLIHVLVISFFVSYIDFVPRWTSDVLVTVAIISLFMVLPAVSLLSMFSYRVVELPFLRLRKSYFSKDEFAGAGH